MTVERIGAVGAGTMGSGIAQLACLGGYETVLQDPLPEALEKGAERLVESLGKGVKREMWSADDAEAAGGRLEVASDVEGLKGCDLVIEAAPEDLELKRRSSTSWPRPAARRRSSPRTPPRCSVTAIAERTPGRERVVGMHFFNPPALMKLVEVVADADSSEEAPRRPPRRRAAGQTPIRAKDSPGFIVNRLARPFASSPCACGRRRRRRRDNRPACRTAAASGWGRSS